MKSAFFFSTQGSSNVTLDYLCFSYSAISAGLRGGCLKLVNQKVNIRIRNTLFAAILNQEVAFFDTIQTGDLYVCMLPCLCDCHCTHSQVISNRAPDKESV